MTTATPGNHQKNATLADRARDAATGAQARVSSATSATVDAARDHPYAAAGIVAGALAAIGGAAYAAKRAGGTGTTTNKGKTRH